jgi:hypothetical protein
MPSPNNIALAVKMLGMSSYKTRNKVWLVSLYPKLGRPFVKGKVIDNTFKDNHFYKVKGIIRD